MMYDAGLILEGGGMRATYSTGVLDFFIEKELFFRNIYGVSAGAGHACSYISRQHGRACKVVVDYSDRKEYCSISSLIKTGDIFGSDFIYRKIPEELVPYDYAAADSYDGNFYAAATDCFTGNAVYFKVADLKNDMDKVRASASLPVLSRPVNINGSYYLDGGVADSIPLAESIRQGNKKNVLILTRQPGYRKEKSSALIPIMKMKYGKKYPGIFEAQKTRHIRYNAALDLVESEIAAGNAFVIRPAKPPQVGRIEKDREKLLELYRLGYEDARASWPALQKFLGITPIEGDF